MTLGKIGRYQLDQSVGEGAYGTVYRAHDTLLDRTVAIKLLNKQAVGKDNPAASLQEAKTLAKLNHPNIVTLFEISDHDGQTAMVMEYLEGEPLRAYMTRVKPSFDQTLKLARQIADALAESHALGVVHADIKPGNIIVRENGVPVVVDFGLSRVASAASDMATLTQGSLGQNLILGTLPYMAPEVMKGGKPDEASDIFSFGSVLYEMLTGKRAFEAASDAEIVHLVLNVDPKPVSVHAPDIPVWCANLVARMLAKEKAARPQGFRDVLKAIDSADAGTPLRDRAAARKAKRMSNIKRVAVAFVLVATLGAGFWGAQYYKGEPLTISGRINSGMDRLRHSQERGAIEEAKALFESVLSKDPQNAAATAGYSLALSYQFADIEADPSTLKNAISAAELALDLDDQLALAYVAAAWGYEFSGETSKAQAAYETAVNLDPSNFFALQGFGRFLRRVNRSDDAMAIYQTAIAQYPREGTFQTALGDIYYRNGNYDAAEQITREGIDKAPDNVFGYRTLGAILFARGDTIAAIAAIQRGLQIRPDPSLYNNLGSFYFSLGQYAQSVDAFERAIDAEGNSHNYFSWANLGDAYSMVPGSEDKAKLAFRRAIQLLTARMQPDETRPGLLSRAGLYYAKAGEFEKAQAMTARAVSIAPKSRSVLFRAAVVADLSGNRPEALDLLKQSIAAGQPLSEIKNEPYLAKLREDPSYHTMVVSLDPK